MKVIKVKLHFWSFNIKLHRQHEDGYSSNCSGSVVSYPHKYSDILQQQNWTTTGWIHSNSSTKQQLTTITNNLKNEYQTLWNETNDLKRSKLNELCAPCRRVNIQIHVIVQILNQKKDCLEFYQQGYAMRHVSSSTRI